MSRLLLKIAVITLLGTATPSSLYADTMQMPAETDSELSFQLPGRGMSMTAVKERFGEPRQQASEVGDPPITRWVYDQFSVYFEYQYVIHAVLHGVDQP